MDNRVQLLKQHFLLQVLKKLTRVEAEAIIDTIMPGITEAAEKDSESRVRKEAIFCMRELHSVVGAETFAKYKLSQRVTRLLDVYLAKANSQSRGNISVASSVKE